MADLKNLISPFFLNNKEIRKIIELFFFCYRDFTARPDQILQKLNFGRAHHRVIYFVGKKDQITIKELLVVLQITKQSLSRVLNQLVKEGYIVVSTGLDKRTKNLSLTSSGISLENELSTIQIQKIKKFDYFPWRASGPCSPGLGSGAGVIAKRTLECSKLSAHFFQGHLCGYPAAGRALRSQRCTSSRYAQNR